MIVLTKDGKLLNWQTSLTYHQADTTVYTRVFAAPSTDHGAFDLTTQDAEFMEVSSLDAVVMLERFSGFLSSVEPISADMVHTITCDANNLERIQTTKIELSGKKENFSATVDTTVVTTDHSRNDIITNEYQIENFSNNTYALNSSNLHKESPDVTYDVMNSYCRNNLVVTLPLLQYIQDARVYNQDGKTLYRFPGTQELSELICSEACNLLYQDPGYLDALASDRNILSTECTLRIHPLTGLPESSSIVYRGTHTIEGKVYNFTSTTVQNYHFS